MIRYSSYDTTVIAQNYLRRLEAEYRELLRLRERVREAEAMHSVDAQDQRDQCWKGLRRPRDN